MASKTKTFSVNPNAIEGGRRDMGVSLNDPFSSARDDVLNNRLQFVYNPSDPVSTLEQQYMQRYGNQSDPRFSNMDVAVSLEPTSTPFPLGCPTGFYQQGNVCIPIVGTYPGDDFNAPPAGQDFAKGEIEDVDLPSTTIAGQTFQIRTHFKNIGAFRGKFATKITIAGISVTGSMSENGFVPGFARGIVYHNISMPATAPNAQNLEAQIELVRWDEVQNKFVTDDVGTVNIPSPGSVPPAPTTDCFTLGGVTYCVATTTGPGCIELNSKIYCPTTSSPQCKTINGIEYCKSTTWQNNCVIENGQIYCPNVCKTINNKQYCKSNTWLPGCIIDSGFVYCPSDPDCKMIGNKEYCKGTTYGPGCIVENNILWCPTATPPPAQGQAVIITSPQNRVEDGKDFKIIGSGFLPNKFIRIDLQVTWHCSCSINGKTDTWTINTTSNNDGKFSVTTKSRDTPNNTGGTVEIVATDGTTPGSATTAIDVYD